MGKTLESPLDCKEIKPVNSKGNWSWIFIGRAHAEAEAPILWPPDAKSQLTGKDLDAEKTEGKRTRGRQRMRRLDGTTNSMDMDLRKLWEILEDRRSWRVAVHGVTKSQKWLTDWTSTTSGERIGKIIDICICIIESLCCTPETITTLLINYTPK